MRPNGSETVAADDIRWVLEPTAPRVRRALVWGERQLGIDAALRARARRAIERAQRDEAGLIRTELAERLARVGIAVNAPATIRDFVWWSGLTTVDAKRGLVLRTSRRA